MRKRLCFVFLLLIISGDLISQNDTLETRKYQFNYGLAINPQMLFVGAFDLGFFGNIETHILDDKLAVLGGVDLRNRWFEINRRSIAIDTRSLKTHYSITGLSYFGLGFSRYSKENERNSFYITAVPYIFSFKESVNTDYISNTVANTNYGYTLGITWSQTKITKRERKINMHFYLPLYGSHFFDDLRFLNLRFGFYL